MSRDPVDYVRTTRGTDSGPRYSHGNCLPATAVPHGFNFWTPVTDARELRWPYRYGDRALQAFGLSHQPSPWIGDRHTFHVMPGTGPVVPGRRRRARAFSHADETDRPYHYGVRLAGGITVDIAPTDHAAVFRFTFPRDGGWLLFDNVRDRGRIRVDASAGTITGHTAVRGRRSPGARRMYLHATVDQLPDSGGQQRRAVAGHLRFGAREVVMRIATSLISPAQAARNHALEVAPPVTFDDVRDRARARWQELLGRVEVAGATDDELTTLYSCLYRMFLYPNSAHEDTPHGIRHASPYGRGRAVRDGTMYVNNGFWDTYRTVWPAYALLAPSRCGELIDGFLRHYRESGWVPRWSCPGPADLMPGTGSDVAFADAYVKGVRGFDARTAYEAAVKNATVTPPRRAVGRKGLGRSVFLGYTPTTTREGMSWTLEGCTADAAIARMAGELGDFGNAGYFTARSRGYANHFDARVGFFQGRDPRGRWRFAPGAYDPRDWGYDCAETNGWTMAFAVPHDGDGLAALYGGRAALEAKLDHYFATPETGSRTGSYHRVTHEMREARDVGLGQYGHSNQPAHHVPYLYCFAGAPAKTQRIVRDVLRRCYRGGEAGRGYLGDEDNGEMSAWYLFSALGLYPLPVGRYAIGSPLFRRAVVHLENGADLVINAPLNNADNVYVRRLRVNGVPHDEPWLDHDVLARGAVLDFDLGPAPSTWGVVTDEPGPPRPLRDLVADSRFPALADDNAATDVGFPTAHPVVEHTANEPRTVRLYTLTSARRGGDPASWVLEGSADGVTWTVLDERHDEAFRWRRQTRAFAIAEPRPFRHHRLRITASTGRRTRLAQWELLT